DLLNKTEVIKRFTQHNEEVLKTVPKERLLVYTVKEGWEPLCKFLNVAVPSAPFPVSNTSEEFKERVANIAKGSRA
ncbi:MAG TPA: sulfotransferase, partial [Bacteroidia bacterium]|nr:sulfotransferase [Bacteroidia bacterium]